MTVFRSEEMECYEVVVAKSVAYQCMAALGELEVVEIIPYPMETRPFINELKVLEDLDQKLRKIVKDLKYRNMHIVAPDPVPETPMPSELTNLGGNKRTSLNLFQKMYQEYAEVSDKVDTIKNNLSQLIEKHQAFLKGHQYFIEIEEEEGKKGVRNMHDLERGSLPFDNRFIVLVGILPSVKKNLIETLLWRLCQGNISIKFFDDFGVSKSKSKKRKKKKKKNRRELELAERKSIILISVHGIKSSKLVTKLCSAYKISLFPMPKKPYERIFVLNRTLEKIFEQRGVLNETSGHRNFLLSQAAEHCRKWFIQIEKMKATYIGLNSLDWSTLEHHAILKYWVTKSKAELAFRAFLGVAKSEGVGSPVFKEVLVFSESPPTYIRTNKFTEAFQHIVDAYGIPSYRELNPMPYTVITFPFLFAVMFGDVGHGTIMASLALIVILFEKRIKRHGITNEIQTLMFKGRYIILLMGLFSMWTGLVYNDYFSKGMFLSFSHWRTSNYDLDYIETHTDIKMDPAIDYMSYPVPVGLDPIWKMADNEILLTNALKMKLAIILGVTQMTFGIILNLFNHLYFRNYLAIFVEFIPQLVFFSCIFVYLVFLFFFKWYKFKAQGTFQESPACAPSILITFINMMMFSFTPSDVEGCDPGMYHGQEFVQKILLLTALCMVPIMYFVEPIVEIVKMKHKGKQNYVEDEGVMSIMVHQFIHVIEFVLGSVSYTASYLRLWALSLAHFQLSQVLWDMVLIVGIENAGFLISVIISLISFLAFAILTLAILVVIEGLSAFLHALRLHWMEFQSKFYVGIGHYFTPFSFRPILIEAKVPLVK